MAQRATVGQIPASSVTNAFLENVFCARLRSKKEFRFWSDVQACTHFTGSDKEITQELFIPDSKIVLPRLAFGASFR